MTHDGVVATSYSGGVMFYIKLPNRILLLSGNADSMDCTRKPSATAVLTYWY